MSSEDRPRSGTFVPSADPPVRRRTRKDEAMLAKSQAKWFFLGGTAMFSVAFLALTVDSLGQVPARSNEQALSESAVRGKVLWDKNNCMGCHTIFGEGAYYAPELTKVVERRGKEWIAAFLKDPEAMFPGKRRMVNYHFDDKQIGDLVAFLDWIGHVDTNGFPAKPDLAPAAAAPVDPAAAARLAAAPGTFKTVCVACHSVSGQGGKVGPALDDVGARFDAEKLDAWLANPSAVKPGTAMPNLGLTPAVRAELTSWLLASKGGSK
jgi:nitric oxide reductase subunit C